MDHLSLLICTFAVMFGCGRVYADDSVYADIKLVDVRVTDADTFAGEVVMFAEGHDSLAWDVDTAVRPIVIKLRKQRIRVAGVDAAELHTVKGDAAKLAVEKLIAGKTIKLTPRGKDNFGRLLAIVTLVDKDGKETILADWLIQHGHGIAYRTNGVVKDK